MVYRDEYRVSETAPYYTDENVAEASQLTRSFGRKAATHRIKNQLGLENLPPRPASPDGPPVATAARRGRPATAWERAEPVQASERVVAGAGREPICVLQDRRPRHQAGPVVAVSDNAPWSHSAQVQRGRKVDNAADTRALAAAWAAADGRGPHEQQQANQGWDFVATGGGADRQDKRYGASSKVGRSECAGRQPICHVGDQIQPDMEMSTRPEFGWGFVSRIDEGPGHGEHGATQRQVNACGGPAAAVAGAGVPSGMEYPVGMHATLGPMSKERGLYKFRGREPPAERTARRTAELANTKATYTQLPTDEQALTEAWTASTVALRDEKPANWVRTQGKQPARPVVDCKLKRGFKPKPGWLAQAEQRRGTAAKAAASRQDHATRSKPNHRVARAARAQAAQSSGCTDPSADPSHPLYKYIHMQAPLQPQPAGTRGTNDSRAQSTRLAASGSDGHAPRLYRHDFQDRSKYFHSINADGTAREVDHFANRYVGPEPNLEAPWGVAELTVKPRVTREKGTSYTPKEYSDKYGAPIRNNEPNPDYVPAVGIPKERDPTQAIVKAYIAEWEAEDPGRKGLIAL